MFQWAFCVSQCAVQQNIKTSISIFLRHFHVFGDERSISRRHQESASGDSTLRFRRRGHQRQPQENRQTAFQGLLGKVINIHRHSFIYSSFTNQSNLDDRIQSFIHNQFFVIHSSVNHVRIHCFVYHNSNIHRLPAHYTSFCIVAIRLHSLRSFIHPLPFPSTLNLPCADSSTVFANCLPRVNARFIVSRWSNLSTWKSWRITRLSLKREILTLSKSKVGAWNRD